MATILCIEDEPEIRADLVEELQDAGFEAIEAANGKDGLDLVLKHEPDLVLCDINMPGMNGYDLVKLLRDNHPRLAHMPFLFLSAFADREDVLKGLKAGADDYITKPVDYDLLLTRIEAALRHARRVQEKKEKEQVTIYKALSGGSALKSPSRPQEAAAPPSPPIENHLERTLRCGVAGAAGKVQFINFDVIKREIGPEWSRLSTKAMSIAEGVIKKYMTNGAVFQRHATDGFLLVFPQLSEVESVFQVQSIANEISSRILGENFSAYRHLSLAAIAKDMKDISGGTMIDSVSGLASALEKNTGFPSTEHDRAPNLVDRLVDQVRMKFQPLWSPKSERVVAYQCCPQWPIGCTRESLEPPDEQGLDRSVVADLELSLMSKLAAYLTEVAGQPNRGAAIFPIHGVTLRTENRQRMAEALDPFPRRALSERLLVEVIPDSHSLSGPVMVEAVGFLKAFCRSVILRASPKEQVAAHAQRAGVKVLSMAFSPQNNNAAEDRATSQLRTFATDCFALGVRPYVHGIDTVGGIRAGMMAGVPMLAGRAIGRETDLPGDAHILQKQRLMF